MQDDKKRERTLFLKKGYLFPLEYVIIKKVKANAEKGRAGRVRKGAPMKFRRFFGLSDAPGSKKDRERRANALHGQTIRYVGEMKDGVENIVGRGGNASVRNGELLIFSSNDVIYRTRVGEVEIADLLSGDGVVLRGPDSVSGSPLRSITVYFVDYHK